MKKKISLLKLILSAMFILNSILLLAQTNPIQLTTIVAPPYPTRFEDWENLSEKIFINLVNISSNDYDVNLITDITGPNGFSLKKSKILDIPVNLISHRTKSIRGDDWDTYGINLKIGDINPESERYFVLKNRAFREGEYTICMQAVNNNTGEILSDKSSGCFTYNVTYGEPPQIINPLKNATVQIQSPSLVRFNWIHQVQGAPFEYTLKIIELNQSVPPDVNQAMNNPGIPSFFEEDNIKGFSKTLRNENFKKGLKYAARITVVDPQNKVYFKNAGQSEIVVFSYGQKESGSCDNLGLFAMKPHFPMEGDTLPFTGFPLIAEMSPTCEDYKQLIYVTTTKGKKSDKITVNWPNGALKFLQKNIGDNNINWQMASKIQLAQNSFGRGERYNWKAVAIVKNKKGQKFKSTIPETNFVVGMPKPRLISPSQNEKVAAGQISFDWKPAFSQKKLLPDYKLIDLINKDKNNKLIESKFNKIYEHWVLQVFSSSTPTNSKLIGTVDGKIDIDPEDYYNSASHTFNASNLMNELGKDIYSDIQIDKQGDYWWRVLWLKNPNGSIKNIGESDIYHASYLTKFHVGSKDDKDTGPEGECIASCDAPPVKDTKATGGLKKDQVLKIGLFALKVTEVKSSKNNIFSGKGEIVIDFLNKMRMEVEFNDIKKNKNNEIFAGSVKAIKNSQYSNFFTKYKTYINYAKKGANEGFKQIKNAFKKSSNELANELKTIAKSTDRLVNSLSGKKTGLPVGLDKSLDGYKFVITIAEMEFTPQKAIMQTLIDVKIPAIEFNIDKYLVLRTKDICFSPTGLGTEGKAFLAVDMNFVLSKDNNADADELVIKGGNDVSKNTTFVEWNCKGFKQINLALEYRFSRKTIIPDDNNNMGRVVAKATINSKHGLNLMGKISMDKFQLPFEQMKGYAFNVSEAYIDLSNISNPSGLKANLPKNYKSKELNNSDPRLSNTWRGFWLKKMEILIPEYIGNVDKNNRNTKVTVENMIIDNSGFTASFKVKDLIKWEENITKDNKNIDGCAFSLELFWANVLQNNLSGAGLEGRIGIPFADKRDYFKYKGIFDNRKEKNKNNAGLVLTVNPEKNTKINLSWIWAEFHLNSTSYLKFKLSQKDNYVDFKLDGTLNISSEKTKKNKDDSESTQKIKEYALKIPGMKIENFGYNSKTGFRKLKTSFTVSQASPQKWLAGFPLNLSEFKMSGGKNPTISFSILLSLMDKKGKSANGLSAKTSLSILTKFDSKKPFENIGIKEVKLDSLSINAKFSGIGISGSINFYDEMVTLNDKKVNKKGFKGKITVSLPANFGGSLEGEFGTIKAKNAQNQNTESWYSYWRVYGKVKLGPTGIPIYSGISLYAMEGGVYHHMTYNAKNKTYNPQFSSILGLEFGVTIGSNDMGKAYNINAKIAGEISNDSKKGVGLQISIKGDIRILNKSMEDKDSKIRGKVELVFGVNKESSIRKGDRYWVYSTIDVFVNFTVIKGGYPGNKLVTSTFYASYSPNKKPNDNKAQNGYWFFNAGTPKERGKLKVNFKFDDKKTKSSKNTKPLIDVVFTNYLMAGHDIPTSMPDPSPEFMRIWKKSKKEEKSSEISSPKVDKMITGKPLPPLPPGQGFAFGSSAYFSIKANPIPFFIDATIALGFDLNMTHSTERTCAESGIQPGIGNWYATGQIYAGLDLELALAVKLWFINEKISLLNASAAMILNGGFPKPNWVYGEGRLRYSVLNNLITGQYHFEIDVGEHCTFTSGTSGQLVNMKFIQSIKPGDKSKKVDVFSECTAAFAIPVNRKLKIPVNKKTFKTIKPYIHEWSLKDGSANVPVEDILFNNEHTAAILSPKVMLKGKTKYTQYLEIRAKEYYSNGGSKMVKDKNNKLWSESIKAEFITGKAPTVIVDKNILYTYPLKNQRFFLKKETDQNMGYIVQRVGTPQLFSAKDRTYIARFTKIDGTDSYMDVPLTFEQNHSIINFSVAGLDNDTYYAMQIVEQKPHNLSEIKNEEYSLGIIGGENNLSEFDSNPLNRNFIGFISNNEDTELLKGSKSTMKSSVIKKRELPGIKVKDSYERLMYHYYFKTSKYNTFRDKIANANWSSKQETKGWGIKVNSIIDEPLEQYDMEGFSNKKFQLGRLAFGFLNNVKSKKRFHDDNYPVNNYITTIIEDKIKNPRTHFFTYLNNKGFRFNNRKDFKYNHMIIILKSSDISKPISKQEMNQFNNQNKNSTKSINTMFSNGENSFLGNTFSGLNTKNDKNSNLIFTNSINYKIETVYQPRFQAESFLKETQIYLCQIVKSHIWFPKKYGYDKSNADHLEYYKYHKLDIDHWRYTYFKNVRRTTIHPYLIDIDAYDKVYTKYMVDKNDDLSGPTVEQYLQNYYSSAWNLFIKILFTSKSSLEYPKDNSFILQYRYPTKESYKKSIARMRNGTNYRVNFTK